MASYGLKATVTAVLNDDDYDIGVTYSDSNGNSFDKRLTGDLDNIEQDITAAVLELYLDTLKQDKDKKKVKPQAKVETSTPLPVTENSVASKFAELEEENRRLNDKINSFMSIHTTEPAVKVKAKEPEIHKDTPCEDPSRRKPDNSVHHHHTSDFDTLFGDNTKELRDLLRLLGFQYLTLGAGMWYNILVTKRGD